MYTNAKAFGRAIPEGVMKSNYESPSTEVCPVQYMGIICQSGNEKFSEDEGEW